MMFVAIALLCRVAVQDREREAVARAVVGQGKTPTGCLMDGQAGAASNHALEPRDGLSLVIVCKPRERLDVALRKFP